MSSRPSPAPAILRAHAHGRARSAAMVAERNAAAAAAASEAYASTVAIDTLDKALVEVDALVAAIVTPEMSEADAYRRAACSYERSVATQLGGAEWWDQRCVDAYRLLWRAANGRACERGA